MSSVRILYNALSPSRRRQLGMVFVLLFVSALAETISIGSILPFLAAITDPDTLGKAPLIGGWLATFPPGPHLIAGMAFVFVALSVLSGALRLLLARASQAVAFNISYDLGNIAFNRVLRQDYSYYVRLHSAELISRFEKLHHITFSVLVSGTQAIVSTFLGLLIIVLLIVVSPLVALVAGGLLVGLYLVTSVLARPRLARCGETVALEWTKRVKILQEGLGGIRDTLLDRSQPAYEQLFRESADKMRRSFTSSAFLSQAPRIFVETAGIVAVGIYVWILAGREGGIAAALPTLGALALGAQRLLPQLQISYVGWTAVVSNAHGLQEIAELLELEDRVPALSHEDTTRFFSQSIRLVGVNFHYPDGTKVLDDVSLTIRRGDRVGIAGQTGSGKSTLMDILLGLLQPSQGDILVDDIPLEGSVRARWQAQVAHVPQVIYLTDDTLAANIAFGVRPDERDMERVRKAARQAGIADFIESLPDGFQSAAGERGVRLSGGQRQRIGIARALYRRPQVLVLDEATSALDNDTEAAVMQSIAALSADMTIIMIAHRLTTLDQCDRVLKVEGGRVSEPATIG